MEENAGAGGWASTADSLVGQLSAAVGISSDILKESLIVEDGAETKECSSVEFEESVLVSRNHSELLTEVKTNGKTSLVDESKTTERTRSSLIQSAQTFEHLQGQHTFTQSSLETPFKHPNSVQSAEKQFSYKQESLEICKSTFDISSKENLGIVPAAFIEKQLSNPDVKLREGYEGQLGRVSGDNRRSEEGEAKATNKREGTEAMSISELQKILTKCREELAQEKATCESLRYYYGCGAGERTEADKPFAGKELKKEVMEVMTLRSHNEKLLMEVDELRKQSTEETERVTEPIERGLDLTRTAFEMTETRDKLRKTEEVNGTEGPKPQEKNNGLQDAGIRERTAQQQTEVELRRVQVEALKVIVSIQEGEVIRKSQLDLTGKEGSLEQSTFEERSQLTESKSSDKNDSKKEENGVDNERQETRKDGSKGEYSGEKDELKGADYVKEVLSRWRKEVYALVLECKEREWEALRESERQKKLLYEERAMREELDSKCKVLEQKAVSLGAELQLYKDAAQQSQEALSKLQKEHKTVRSARDQAETGLRTLASSVREWHQKEEAQTERLAESEQKLRGFVRRLTFAESRVAVGRQLGRVRKAASQVEEKPLEKVVNGVGKRQELNVMSESQRIGPRDALRGSREHGETRNEQESHVERELSGLAKHGRGEQTADEKVNETHSLERWQKQGTSSVTRSCSHRGLVQQMAKSVVGSFMTVDKELEAEIVRLQEERAMLVDRVDQLEGGFVLASMSAKLGEVEASLFAGMERAESAETRAANLEELLASARASLALEGEAVRQLQTQLHDLEVSSKKALSRQSRQCEEQARGDLAAAKDAHEKVTSALQSRVSALERENAKLLVNLRQLERQAAHTKERKQTERDARLCELESWLEQRDADLKSVRKERSVLLAQLRKLQKDAHTQLERDEKQQTRLEREQKRHVHLEREEIRHVQVERERMQHVQLERERKLHSYDKGLHAEVVVTPAPSKESKRRQPLTEASSAHKNGAALVARREGQQEGESIIQTIPTFQTPDSVWKRQSRQNESGRGMDEAFSGVEEGSANLLPSLGMRPIDTAHSSRVEKSLLGGLEISDSKYGSGQEVLPEFGLYAFRESSQRRRVSEVIDESSDDLMTRLNKLAQLSSAILEDPTMM